MKKMKILRAVLFVSVGHRFFEECNIPTDLIQLQWNIFITKQLALSKFRQWISS